MICCGFVSHFLAKRGVADGTVVNYYVGDWLGSVICTRANGADWVVWGWGCWEVVGASWGVVGRQHKCCLY